MHSEHVAVDAPLGVRVREGCRKTALALGPEVRAVREEVIVQRCCFKTTCCSEVGASTSINGC